MLWYVCNGTVEQYRGQEANWSESVIVFAKSPEKALPKVMKYHLGKLPSRGAVYEGKEIRVITWNRAPLKRQGDRLIVPQENVQIVEK